MAASDATRFCLQIRFERPVAVVTPVITVHITAIAIVTVSVIIINHKEEGEEEEGERAKESFRSRSFALVIGRTPEWAWPTQTPGQVLWRHEPSSSRQRLPTVDSAPTQRHRPLTSADLNGKRRASCGGGGGATHSHVRPAACVSGFGDGVHQLTADAKVAQLYVAVAVQEDVGRLDVCEGDRTEA